MSLNKLQIKLISASLPDLNRLERFVGHVVEITFHEGPKITGKLSRGTDSKIRFSYFTLNSNGVVKVTEIISAEHVKYIKLHLGG